MNTHTLNLVNAMVKHLGLSTSSIRPLCGDKWIVDIRKWNTPKDEKTCLVFETNKFNSPLKFYHTLKGMCK